MKYKERSTGRTFKINPQIDNPFYDTFLSKFVSVRRIYNCLINGNKRNYEMNTN